MAADAVPLRKGQETPSERIDRLQGEIAEAARIGTNDLRHHLSDVCVACDEAKGYPISPGEREEYRKLAEYIDSALTRLEAIASRR